VLIYKTSVYHLLINKYIILVPDDMTVDHNKNSNNKQFVTEQLKWLVVYICIGFVISFFLSFPLSLVVAFGIYILIFYLRDRTLKKKCINANKKSIFDFLSSSPAFANELGQLKYYCMCCAKEHRESVCPNCGSKMKRAST
jgi:Na+/H+ antiporter NhaD/arsenite permease-like protein